MKSIEANTVIIGGGIAGLWTLNHLNNLGINAILLENNELGSKQTICSQGIIHGGLKYALQGALSKDSESIANMPTVWRNCLAGNGPVNLTAAKILSENQFLFSTNSLTSKITNFFASKFLKSRIMATRKDDSSEIFSHKQFKGNIYKLDEIVLDIKSVISSLANNFKDNIIKTDKTNFSINKNSNGNIESIAILINNEEHLVTAENFIFSAGENNKNLYKNSVQTDMQLRPLHMIYLIGKNLPKLFGHCVDGGMLPKATITTNYTLDGTPVWYIGGKVAESGLDKDSSLQIKAALAEITSIFPWLDLTNIKSGSFFINRAEAKQPSLDKPETATVFKENNYIIAWPTKLALAPILANNIFKIINSNQNTDNKIELKPEDYSNYPKPKVASYPWDI